MAAAKEDLPTTIIKSDRAGRPRYSQEFKDEVLAAFEGSGMSGPAFAAHCGLKYPTFASWVSKRRREKAPGSASASKERFVLAEFSEGRAGEGVWVELPGGAKARLTEASQAGLVAALIRALG